MKGTFTSIKKMRMPLVHQWRWLFVFLMLLSSLPGWTKDGNIKVTLNEKTLLNGSFYIETYGDGGDFDDCYNDIRNNQFYSISFFDNAAGRWCYEFYIHQWEPNAHDNKGKYNSIDTDINVYVYDLKSYPYYIGTIVHSSEGPVKGSGWGVLKKKGSDDGVYQYYPSDQMMYKGITKMLFTFHYNHNRNNKKDKGYDIKLYKGMDEGLVFNYTPMPKAELSTASNGYVNFKASGVPGGAETCYYRWHMVSSGESRWSSFYSLNLMADGTGWDKSKKSNKIDATTTEKRMQPLYGYYVSYRGCVGGGVVDVYDNPASINGLINEWEDTIKGYLYPTNLQVTPFDQWKKQVTVSWSAVRTDRFHVDNFEYRRNTDGNWCVFRGYMEDGNFVSTQIATLSGDTGDGGLRYTDTKLDYDKNYIYSVVFVPTVMKNTDISWFDDRLKPSISVNTDRDVLLTLTQDRDEELPGIKLDWTYSIKQSGSTFRVERKDEVTNTWRILADSQMPVNTSQTQASYIDYTPSSSCEYYDYRVVATTIGSEFTSNELTCNLPAGTKITGIDATKGTEEKVVIVTWTVDQRGTSDSYFNIERRTISNEGTSDWVKVGETHGTLPEYSFTDERVQAGSYYEYRVVLYGIKCEEQMAQSDEITTMGFCLATGTITGHISYGTGNSVKGVHVSLVKSGTDNNLQQFFSSYINGSGEALTWQPDAGRYGNVLTSSAPLSVQMWVAPVGNRDYMPIFTLDGVVEVGLSAVGENYELCYKDIYSHLHTLNATLEADRFTHITASYDTKQWTFYLNNGDKLQTVTAVLPYAWTLADGTHLFRVGSLGSDDSFTGLIDEVRLWTKALSSDEVSNNYDRLIGGSENGLILYWPLDEGINGYAFDISKQNGINNENHATVSANVKPCIITPLRLGLYGITDDDGNYIVRGVPFDAGGTNYKLVPEFGIHEFSPISRNLYISPSSLSINNVDFTDKSSFPLTGFIYYKDTNIPVKGIYLYVDGNLVTTGGEVAQTDDMGYYTISVPIGEHFIEAKQSGHDMVDGGRWPTQGTYDFQEATHHNFSDSTLVNFCGRVAGGEVQDALPVGFGTESGSKNNIGRALITLEISNLHLSFNCEEGTTNDRNTTRPFSAQNPDTIQNTIQSTAWAGAGEWSRNIYIETDTKTGEFSALLPPLKYSVISIDVPSNPEVEFTALPEIDLTNPISFMVDTLMSLDTDSNLERNLDVRTYKYNQKMVKTWYATPTLEVTDLNDLEGIGAYGVMQYDGYEDEYGTVDGIQVYEVNADNTPRYLYDYPIYKMKEKYTYKIKGYEKYTNHDGLTPIDDILPMQSQVLTVENEMSSDQRIVTQDSPENDVKEGEVYDLKSNQLALDDKGEFLYQWTAGLPNTVYPYTRHVGITYKRNNRTYQWDGIDAMVFGSMPLGNNFVTKGPDNVLMVLRDPPGSNSSTTWTQGQVNTEMKKTAKGYAGNLGILGEIVTGVELGEATGFGLAIITQQGADQQIHGGVDISANYSNPITDTYTITATEAISTSSNKEYVGANGDIYIGLSTNLILGDCKKVGFFRDGPNDNTFAVKDSMAISISDSVTTSFMFTQREIELKQIPEWKALRSQLLIPVNSKKEAEAYPNPTNESLYVTWQPLDSEEWIADETYIQIPPKDGHAEEDMVHYYTAQVAAWEQVMANNEEDKVLSMSTSSPYYEEKRNFSFDSGTTYNYSEKTDSTHSDVNQWNYSVIVKGDVKFGVYASTGSKFGINLTISGSSGFQGSSAWSNLDENYTHTAQFTYNFSDTNIGSDYTVDAYKSVKGWTNVFSVLGGQTYCPYEGEITTKYYEPGKYVLSNATAKMQNPQIRISNGMQAPSKEAVLTDIPTGQPAYFTLTLSNDAEADMDMTFVLGEKDGSNPNGLQFIIDGVRFNSGRSVVVPSGGTITKTLEVRQSDVSILDYDDVVINFASSCQSDTYSVNGIIRDQCTFGVHFKPSSSPVILETDGFVVNTVTGGNLALTLTGFDRNFQGLKTMGVEYKSDGATRWTQVQDYYFNAADASEEDDIVVPATGDVKLNIDMSDSNSYPDGTYIFRAYTETPYGTENIRVYSEEMVVTRDMSRPTALGTPQPTDGILHAGDDLVVEFNEDIVPGYVNASNVQVVGKVNHQPTTHEVSLHLSGTEPTAYTANDLYMRGNSTVALWLKYTEAGTIFRHCAGENALVFGIDGEGHLTVKTSDSENTSKLTLPKDEWTYLAYSYDEESTALNVIVQHGTETETINVYFGNVRTLEQVIYADDKRLFLGGDGLEADIHDLRIYGITRDVHEVAAEKYSDTNIYTAGLMAHWPMDEGQGTKARDLCSDAHPFVLNAPNWRINNDNYAATVDASKEQHLDLDVATSITDNNESYVLEFWFKADEPIAEKTVFQAGTDADNNLRLFGDESGSLMFEYGIHLVPVAPAAFDPTSGWHHFALNVMRGASASVSIDGKRTAVFAEREVPPFESATLVMGAGYEIPLDMVTQYHQFMSGSFDEIRFWKGMVKPEVVKGNMYHNIDTLTAAVQGLSVYYPMETTAEVNGVVVNTPSDKDMAPGQIQARSMTGQYDLAAFSNNAPPLRSVPEMQSIINQATVSDRKMVITLQPNSLSEIEGTTLDITVNKIFDKNGNTSIPVTWQVYVHQNTLLWEKDSVNVIKDYGEEATFDVAIQNIGNATELYSVENLPTWLSMDDTDGNLSPESQQVLRFHVADAVAVGLYDVTLTLVGNNGISEPLRVVMKVKGQAPDWTVDLSQYEDHMNMVGQVIIDGIVSENPDSRMAAFIGSECVGVGSPEKSRGSYYVAMTICGSVDEHSGKPLQFKYWDASTGITYVGMKVEPEVVFWKNSMKGSYAYPVILTNADEVQQTLIAEAGWNWLSFYVQPTNASVDDNLRADGLVQGDALKDKSSVSYYDGTGWGNGNLTSIRVGDMYKLCVSEPVRFEVKGHYAHPSETPITVKFGWNWIGYTPARALDVHQALGGIGAVEGDYVKSKTAFAIYGPYGWEGNLKAMEPGKGYMYFTQVIDPHTFTYPDVETVSSGLTKAPKSTRSYIFTPVDANQYPDNMSIVLQLVDGAEVVDTAEVGAFIDGECRATATAINGLYYLMVQGEDGGQTIELLTVLDGQELTIDKSLTFESDTNVGLPWAPYVIDLGVVTGIHTIAADTDDGIQYYLPNGIRVDKSALRKGQLYILKDKAGKILKYLK